MDGHHEDEPDHVIDLTGVPASAELRADVEQMMDEVHAAARRVAPLLRDAVRARFRPLEGAPEPEPETAPQPQEA